MNTRVLRSGSRLPHDLRVNTPVLVGLRGLSPFLFLAPAQQGAPADSPSATSRRPARG